MHIRPNFLENPEDLDDSDCSCGSSHHVSVLIPIDVEDNLVIIGVVRPKNFVFPTVNKLDLASRSDYHYVFREVILVLLGFDWTPC